MSTMTPVPNNHPVMLAWRAYQATPEYANTKKWAVHEKHIEGSLWAAFLAGCTAMTPTPASSRSAEETANGIVRQWDDEGGYNARRLSVLIARIAAAPTAAQASERVQAFEDVKASGCPHACASPCPFHRKMDGFISRARRDGKQ
jgi:hypothetical protein